MSESRSLRDERQPILCDLPDVRQYPAHVFNHGQHLPSAFENHGNQPGPPPPQLQKSMPLNYAIERWVVLYGIKII